MSRKKIKIYTITKSRDANGKRIYLMCWPDASKANGKAFHKLESKTSEERYQEAERYYHDNFGVISAVDPNKRLPVIVTNDAPETVADLVDVYTRRRAAGHAHTDQPHTIREVTNRLKKYVLPILGQLRLSDVTPEHIVELYETVRKMPGRKNAPLAAKSVTNIMTDTKTMFKYAVEKNWLSCSPYDSTLKLAPKKIKLTARVEGLETYRRLIAKPWKYPIAHRAALLSLSTGMRAGEIRALREKDIEPRDGYAIVHIRHNIEEDGTLKTPKNGDERLTVIPIWVYELIADLFIGEPDSFIFRNPQSTLPVTAPTILRGYRIELANLLGVDEETLKAEGTKFHSLRLVYNSAASNYFGGKDANILSYVMGHRSNSMQMRYFKLMEAHYPKILEAHKEVFPDDMIADIQEAFSADAGWEKVIP